MDNNSNNFNNRDMFVARADSAIREEKFMLISHSHRPRTNRRTPVSQDHHNSMVDRREALPCRDLVRTWVLSRHCS